MKKSAETKTPEMNGYKLDLILRELLWYKEELEKNAKTVEDIEFALTKMQENIFPGELYKKALEGKLLKSEKYPKEKAALLSGSISFTDTNVRNIFLKSFSSHVNLYRGADYHSIDSLLYLDFQKVMRGLVQKKAQIVDRDAIAKAMLAISFCKESLEKVKTLSAEDMDITTLIENIAVLDRSRAVLYTSFDRFSQECKERQDKTIKLFTDVCSAIQEKQFELLHFLSQDIEQHFELHNEAKRAIEAESGDPRFAGLYDNIVHALKKREELLEPMRNSECSALLNKIKSALGKENVKSLIFSDRTRKPIGKERSSEAERPQTLKMKS
jgi:hypothetical protein